MSIFDVVLVAAIVYFWLTVLGYAVFIFIGGCIVWKNKHDWRGT